MPTRKTSAAPKEAGARARTRDGVTASDGEPDWKQVSKDLAPYADLYERWRTKAITTEEYCKDRGCFSDCTLVHPDGQHFPPQDGYPALIVTMTNEWPATHRRRDGSRNMPSYIFTPGQPVRITDPCDKFAYVNRHITNPEAWAVAFEGSPQSPGGTPKED